jgi:glycerol-3-phosphate acyltransferase PlsY
VTRYVSLGSICGTAALAGYAFLHGAPPSVSWAATAAGTLIVFRHRANLARIANGTESRVGSR